MIRLLIADDSPSVIRALRNLLESTEDVRIVGEAKNCDDALRLTETLRPGVLLLDLNLPGSKAHMLDLRNLTVACACQIVATSFAVDGATQQIAASVGAARLLDKIRLYDTFLPTLREVAK